MSFGSVQYRAEGVPTSWAWTHPPDPLGYQMRGQLEQRRKFDSQEEQVGTTELVLK